MITTLTQPITVITILLTIILGVLTALNHLPASEYLDFEKWLLGSVAVGRGIAAFGKGN